MTKKEKNEPLNLPRGSIRAIITLLITISIIASFAIPQIERPEWFTDLWLVAVGYYIGYRSDNSQIKVIE
jgi:hypothetical protein